MKPRALAWIVVAVTAGLFAVALQGGIGDEPVWAYFFWIGLLIVAELLPVSVGLRSSVTMAFPVQIATSILFPPAGAMLIAGLGAFDAREFRRQIPLARALFNRAQLMLAAGATSALIHLIAPQPFTFPRGAFFLTLGAVAHTVTNLGLVAMMISRSTETSYLSTVDSLIPKPALGFGVAQVLLAGLGVATAAAYPRLGPFVSVFIIPLLLARLSILGARAQHQLSERIRKQQESLLQATDRVFEERERERHRIAEELHDTALQSLASASYSCGMATALMDAGRPEDARTSITGAQAAIGESMVQLRESLFDLRRSLVEAGGLVETVRHFAEQVSPMWDADIRVESSLEEEPPAPVALAGFQILQEALVNALKHAGKEVVVSLADDPAGMLRIVVEDHGPGFDTAAEVGGEHLGMRLMKERAERVGGRIAIESQLGTGTKVEAVLPATVVH
ncbi:MAG: histidine kinase [Actinomycetota bacterium]|nr:histidine kinase [Actinomycetota bacterium]